MDYDIINKARRLLVSSLDKYSGDKPIKIKIDKYILKEILFLNIGYYVFIPNLEDVYCKIDWSDIPMDRVRVIGKDLSKYRNIKINPQTVHNKDLSNTIYKGVEFVGLFDDANIVRTNFAGSIDAIINPQTVRSKDLSYGIFKDVIFTDTFDGACIIGANFDGSNKGLIDVSRVYQRRLSNANLGSTILSGSFYGCDTSNTTFVNAIYEGQLIEDDKTFKTSIYRKVRAKNKQNMMP